jgi:hypothetical protein
MSPSFVAACTRDVFSLKWRAATINLKYIFLRFEFKKYTETKNISEGYSI